ncbi:MAG: hypothetical protein EBU46_16445 [Nitrosomonadaceae bacterium]|nr:hypothetical protein [Nitrosomonadaceae bacterium]
MISFGDVCPIDYIYFKIAGNRLVEQMPLCELALANNVEFDPKSSTADMLVLIEPVQNGKSFKFSKAALLQKIAQDVYGGMYKVVDLVVQPGGEPRTPEVQQFMEKYYK